MLIKLRSQFSARRTRTLQKINNILTGKWTWDLPAYNKIYALKSTYSFRSLKWYNHSVERRFEVYKDRTFFIGPSQVLESDLWIQLGIKMYWDELKYNTIRKTCVENYVISCLKMQKENTEICTILMCIKLNVMNIHWINTEVYFGMVTNWIYFLTV
jgi:hypothetical protein